MVHDTPAIRPPDTAHIGICPGCENPFLIADLVRDNAAMQCARCGTVVRPRDINTYTLDDDE